ncbi:MAG: hypothetical protein AAGA42_20925, partial [Actinomycetota bacterium]
AVRAVVSVMVGERPPDLIDGFDQLAHPSMHVLEDAERLLEDDSVDPVQRADLERLTRFFFDPEGFEAATDPVAADEEPAVTEPDGLVRPQGLARGARQVRCPGDVVQIDEWVIFEATRTNLDYCKEQRGDDIVYYPVQFDRSADGESEPDATTGAQVAQVMFELIDEARTVYRDRAGSELQPIFFLISPRPDPSGNALGHVVGRSSERRCTGAILLSDDMFIRGPELEFTMAHELFHCIQATWPGGTLTEFVSEGGADYFAGLVVPEGKCSSGQVSEGRKIDSLTANGSLLDAKYDGWVFWDYLEAFRDMPSQQISQMHQAVKSGTSIDDAMQGFVPDLRRSINEFYVRLMGPGLACDIRGSAFTADETIEDVGEVTFADAPWRGTRYKVTYPEMRYFAQEAGDGDPIGMADIDEARSEAGWVVVAPEIRSKCDEEAEWAVVLARPPSGSGAADDRKLQVTDRQDTDCDPCPVGDWSFDLASMAQFFESFDQGSGADVAISGTWTVAVVGSRDGSPTEISDAQDVVLTFTIDGNSLPIAVTGRGSGSWTGDETTLGLPSYQSSGQASFFDRTTSVTETGAAALGYTCDDGVMTFAANGTEVTLTREADEGERYFGTGG